jgi:hypothetical protein
MAGIDPRKLTGGYASYNLAAYYCDFLGQKILINSYILNHCPVIKVICSSLDVALIGYPEGFVSWDANVGQSKGYRYDSCHNFWSEGVSEVLKEVLFGVPLPLPEAAERMGCSDAPSLGWGPDPPPCTYQNSGWTIHDSIMQYNLGVVRVIADTLRARGIHWIMINFPMSPNYKKIDCYCVGGVTWQTARDIILNLKQLESANEFFHMYDAHNDGNHDYGYNDFFDTHHLSGRGAAKVTARVDSIIHSILQ